MTYGEKKELNITDVLLLFRDTQDITVLHINAESANIEELNVIAIEILSWLKLEHKRMLWQAEGKKIQLKPMHLNMQFSWCKCLMGIMDFKNDFSDVLIVKDGDLGFRDDVDEDYRSYARERAYYKYKPQKIV